MTSRAASPGNRSNNGAPGGALEPHLGPAAQALVTLFALILVLSLAEIGGRGRRARQSGRPEVHGSKVRPVRARQSRRIAQDSPVRRYAAPVGADSLHEHDRSAPGQPLPAWLRRLRLREAAIVVLRYGAVHGFSRSVLYAAFKDQFGEYTLRGLLDWLSDKPAADGAPRLGILHAIPRASGGYAGLKLAGDLPTAVWRLRRDKALPYPAIVLPAFVYMPEGATPVTPVTPVTQATQAVDAAAAASARRDGPVGRDAARPGDAGDHGAGAPEAGESEGEPVDAPADAPDRSSGAETDARPDDGSVAPDVVLLADSRPARALALSGAVAYPAVVIEVTRTVTRRRVRVRRHPAFPRA